MPKLFNLVRLQGSQTGTLNKAVTFTNGSPTIGSTAHGFVADQPVRLATTGGLPTNFAIATTYFVRATNLATDSFELSATQGGAAISAGSAGTGTHSAQGGLLVDTALTGWLTFAGAGAADADDVTAAINDTSHSMIFEGVYYSSGTWLSINTILTSTNSNAMIDLSGTQEIGCVPSTKHFFDKGTQLLLPQSTAPSGWSFENTNNDKALRLVNTGGGGTGGSSAFSTVFGKTATDATTLTSATIPAHTHTGTFHAAGTGHTHVVSVQILAGAMPENTGSGTWTSSSTGSGDSHTHPMDIRVQYVDVRTIQKD